jgi:serine/threonine protein kinase
MMKEGHDLRATLGMGDWKERFFVLYYTEEWKEFHLLYYKEELNFERTESQGAIALAGATVATIAKAPAGCFGFVVTTARGKRYPMRVKAEGQRDMWLQMLTKAINPSAASLAPLTGDVYISQASRDTRGQATSPGGSGPSVAAASTPRSTSKVIAVTDFELKAVVGKGAFGKVFLVEKREGDLMGLPLAMKVLDKQVIADKGQVAHTMSERDILREVQHPFLVRMHYAFQTERKLYMVTDYYPGGNLFAHVQRAKRAGGFEEARARFYAAELCLALEFLHQNNVVYRDLKLENILMDMEGHVVLTDFGLSKDKVADVTACCLSTFCGTVEYMAPELVRGKKYSVAVDWWAFGVLVFEMMCTRTPFFHEKGRKAIFNGIIKEEVSFPMHFSAASQDCISKLLAKDEKSRLGMGPGRAGDIKAHPWFADAIDWALLYTRELKPPWTPDVKSVTDFKYVPKRLQAADARDSEVDDGTGAADVSEAAKWDFTFVQKSKLGDE